jgi:hypothetical protein
MNREISTVGTALIAKSAPKSKSSKNEENAEVAGIYQVAPTSVGIAEIYFGRKF